MPTLRTLSIEEAKVLTPYECFCEVGKPYSKNLEKNIISQIVNNDYRMIKVSYGDPLMKRHSAMAIVTYINKSDETIVEYILD